MRWGRVEDISFGSGDPTKTSFVGGMGSLHDFHLTSLGIFTSSWWFGKVSLFVLIDVEGKGEFKKNFCSKKGVSYQYYLFMVQLHNVDNFKHSTIV